jgi:hypothetical protein
MSQAKDMNLSILWHQHRMTKKAQRGHKELSALIQRREDKALDFLFQSVASRRSTDDTAEVIDDIDQLMKAYMVLMIAILTNRVAIDLPSLISEEIKEVLGNKITQYYYKNLKPLILPQLLYAIVTDEPTKERVMAVANNVQNDGCFDAFISIDHEIETDEDVNMFLKLMDGRNNGGVTRLDLLGLLAEEPERLRHVLSDQHDVEDILSGSAKGLLKYLDILDEYRELLQDSDNLPVLASACWHKQSYWLMNNSNEFYHWMHMLLINLYSALNISKLEMESEHYGIRNEVLLELSAQAKKIVLQSFSNLEFMHQKKLEVPLINLLHGPGTLGPTN